jgi:hypothetical protein
MGTLLGSMALGVVLLSQKIYLAGPALRYTRLFYLGLGILPGVVVLALCARRRPAGSRAWMGILPAFYVLFCLFYWALINPASVTDAHCGPAAVSGLAVHQECSCQWGGASQARLERCSLDGVTFLPFARLTLPDTGN